MATAHALDLTVADALAPDVHDDVADRLLRQWAEGERNRKGEQLDRRAHAIVRTLPADQRGMFLRLTRSWDLPVEVLAQLIEAFATAKDFEEALVRFDAIRSQLGPRGQAGVDEWLRVAARLIRGTRGSGVMRAVRFALVIVSARSCDHVLRHRRRCDAVKAPPIARALVHDTDPAPPVVAAPMPTSSEAAPA